MLVLSVVSQWFLGYLLQDQTIGYRPNSDANLSDNENLISNSIVLLSLIFIKMIPEKQNGVPPTSGQIPPTSGYFDWPKLRPSYGVCTCMALDA